MNEAFMPNEPIRFTRDDLHRLLVHCEGLPFSDLTLQTNEPALAEVYGRFTAVTRRRLNNAEVAGMLSDMYGPNGPAQLASGKDVDTQYEVRPDRDTRYRYRVNATGIYVDGSEGIQITIRSIPTEPPVLANMQVEPAIWENCAPKQGMVLVTGATGSGKSTLLAAVIRALAEDPEGHRKILTYEAPIEFVYDAVEKPSTVIGQTQIPQQLPNFAAGVRNALRRKPSIILVGEARDPETIRAAIEASLTGHLVYSTVHSNGVAETIYRLINVFPQGERNFMAVNILEATRLIVSQTLVPSTDGKRVALREYLVIDDAVRDRLREVLATNIDRLVATTRDLVRIHGQSFAQDAQTKFAAGRITQRQLDIICFGAVQADRDADEILLTVAEASPRVADARDAEENSDVA